MAFAVIAFLLIEEEVSERLIGPLNFPRRKVQTERSETLPICQRCKQVFFKKQSYTRHVAQSTCDILEYDFKCCICPMSFMSNEELQTHEHLHRANMFFCHKYCGKYFNSIDQCEMHEYMQHDYVTYVCNMCSSSFATREHICAHLPQHRHQQRFDCAICRVWFNTPLELHQHRLAAPFFCGKFYNGAQGANSCSTFFPPGLSQTHQQQAHFSQQQQQQQQPSYKLQDCRMGVIENSAHNRITAYFNNRPFQMHQQMPSHAPPQQPFMAQQQASFHAQRQQQQHHQQQQHAQPNFMHSNFQLGPPTLPIIKTEIKVEKDFLSEYTPQFNDFTNDSTSYGSSHNSLSFNSSNDFSNSSNNFNFPPPSPSNLNTQVATSLADDSDDAICCVPKCGVRKSTSQTLQFFTFPKDEKYLHQWLHNLKMLYNPQTNYSNYRICSLHFPKRCINRYSLCYWAIPTFNLGHDDVANLYQNREITNTFTSGDNAQCSMPGCSSQRGESNCKFYNFPNDTKTLIKWCQNARLQVYAKEPRHFCSRHFEDRCFGKFRLKPWAVPTLFLGTPFGKIHDNPGIFYLEEKKCCLPHCRRTRSSDFNLSLYRFPRDETLLRRWCYNLRLNPDIYRGKNHKICSGHFIKEALGLRKLSPGAVPTLNLGHNDTFNIYENELPPAPPALPPTPTQHHSAKSYNFPHSTFSAADFVSTSYGAADHESKSFHHFSLNTTPKADYDSIDICFVPSCKRNRHTDDITLHTIPRRQEQMQKWCHNLKLDIEKLHKGVRICSAHFETYCIGGCMRPFAVPTLNLGHDDPNIYKNPDVIKKLNIRETCCVASCRRNRDRDHANLHRFPSDNELLIKWCENLKKALPDGTKMFNDAICEMHFEDRCLRNRRIEKWSIPTLNLGHEDIVHALPSETEVAELWATKPTTTPNTGDEEGECCVDTCKRNPQVDNVRLFRAPEDADMLAKWAYNLQVEFDDLTNLRVCSEHFEPHCMGKRLRSWAIPTVNLACEIENLFKNPIRMGTLKKEHRQKEHDPTKPTWTPRCCLSHCRKVRHIDGVQLFRFPNLHRSMLAKWCHNLQMPMVGNGQRRLCSTHFEPHVLTKRCPMLMSVPTLNLNTPPGYKIYQNPARLKIAKMRLECVCNVSSCRRSRSDGVQLFRYPQNRVLLKKWCHNTRQKANEALRAQYRICSRHFEPHSFGAKRLVQGAIPTLELGVDEEKDFKLYPNEAQSFSEMRCVVAGCEAMKDMEGVRLFKFPCDDEDLLWKWCNNLKMNPVDCQRVRICNGHFEPDCMGPKLLYKWAIPTQQLGHDDADIELIPNPRPDERYSCEMIFKCCLPTCGKTRKYDEAQMNSFPKHLKLFRRWQHNLKLDFLDFKEREKYKICNDHFEPVCLGKGRLNHGAIPTVNLGHDQTDDLYQVDPEQLSVSLFGKSRPLVGGKDPDQSFEMDENEDTSTEIENKCSYPDCAATKTLLREPYDMPSNASILQLWCSQFTPAPSSDSPLPVEGKLCGLHYIAIYEATLKAATKLKTEDPTLVDELRKLRDSYERCSNSLVVCSAQCSVEGCRSNQFGTHKLYQFPYGTDLIRKWSFNTGIEVDEHRRYLHKVCALHFEPYCLTDAQRLRPWAIPTLQLPPDIAVNKDIYQNPDLGALERRQLGPATTKCCVPGCGRDKTAADDESLRLFGFPIADEALLKKWLHNLQLEREKCPLYRICEHHFAPSFVGNSRLRSGAIPTLNLGNDLTDIYENPPPPVASAITDDDMPLVRVKMKKSLDWIKCCVPTCRRSRLQHGVRLFEFPLGPSLRKKWCHNLQLPMSAIKSHTRVCNLHFHKRCIDGKQLRSWAKPTKNLGHSEAIYENPKSLPGIFLPTCSLPHCRQRRTLENNLRTFGFPKDVELLRKWSANLKLDLADCRGRICTEHFDTNAMGNRKLRAGAVPTLNLGHNEQPLPYDNNELRAVPLSMLDFSTVNSAEEHDEGTVDSISNDADDFDAADNTNGSTKTPMKYTSTNNLHSTPLHNVEKAATLNDSLAPFSPVVRNPRTVNNVSPICCLQHCRKEKTAKHHLTTFGFPKDRQLLLKWCDNLRLQPADCIGRVCIEHFAPHMFAWNRRLKPGALPTVNLGYDDAEVKHTTINGSIFEQNKTMQSATPLSNTPNHEKSHTDSNAADDSTERDTTMSSNHCAAKVNDSVFRLCCLKHCRRKKETSEGHVRTFRFPRDPEYFQKWCEKVQLPAELCHGRRLCEEHFEPSVMGRVKLLAGAVPTLDLVDNEPTLRHPIPPQLETPLTEEQQLEESTHKLPENHSRARNICAIADCASRNNKFIRRFFRFPINDTQLMKKWCENVNFDHEKACRSKICQYHFEACCFRTQRRLYCWAIPTVNVGQPTADLPHQNPKKVTQFSKLRCCIASCRKSFQRHGIQLYRFPINQALARKWFHNTKQPLRTSAIRAPRRICALHFAPEALQNGRPYIWAIPTLRLGHNDAIFDNPAKQINNIQQQTKCCVKGCVSVEAEEAKHYSFPTRGALLRKWAHNTQQDGYLAQRKGYKVCRVHFEEACFDASDEIKSNAIPTLNLDGEVLSAYTLEDDTLNETEMANLSCIVTNCQRAEVKDAVKCYAFPTDTELLQKWCHNLRLQAADCQNAYVCGMHFEPVCFNSRQKLHAQVVPTLELGYDTTAVELHDNSALSLQQTTSSPIAPVRCCVKDCGKMRLRDGVQMYSLPKARALFLAWTHNLKWKPPNMRLQYMYKVCSDHFENYCKGLRKLKCGAIPTLKLGHTDENIYHNNMKLRHANYGFRGHRLRIVHSGKCAVSACKATSLWKMRLCSLPDNELVRQEWRKHLALDSAEVAGQGGDQKLCSLHFLDAYETCKPAQIITGDDEDSKELLNSLQRFYEHIKEGSRIKLLLCAVPGCNNNITNAQIKLFQFPANNELFEKWQHNTKVEMDVSRRYLYKVCSEHFETACFGNSRLRACALPTLKLNHDDTIYENPIEEKEEIVKTKPARPVNTTKQCCVTGCSSVKAAETSIKLLHFPSTEETCEKWRHNLALTPETNTHNLRICSLHFEPYCIGKLLRAWAVPTLHLNIDQKNLYENPPHEVLFYACCVSTCRQTQDIEAGIRLYHFPKHEELFEKWRHNVRMDAETCRYARICTLHFEKQCIGTKLMPWAIPTLDLGHNEEDIFKTPKVKLKTHADKCCLPHCNKFRRQHGVKLYQFPRDAEVLTRWWQNLRISAQEVKHRKICEQHFEPFCVNLRGLKPWAIPTRNLGHTHEILENISPKDIAEYETALSKKLVTVKADTSLAATTTDSVGKQFIVKSCCITTCQQSSETTKLFNFPKIEWLQLKWCENTQVPTDMARRVKICALHFEEHAMSSKRPRPWAVPTLELGTSTPPPHGNITPAKMLRFHPEEQECGEMKYVRSSYCAIVSCMKSRHDGVQLFQYPSKGSMLRKWAENCKHYTYQAARYRFRICSDHFEEHCINGNRLLFGAVPTRNLGHTDEQIHHSVLKQARYKLKLAAAQAATATFSCSVPHCTTSDVERNKLYKFPRNPELLQKWCSNLKMDLKMESCKNARICGIHFEERCINAGRLRLRAVPTRALGHQESEIFENPETFDRPEVIVRCCVSNCGKSKQEDEVLLSAFPKQRSLFEKWALNLKLPLTSEVWHHYRVCSEHFEPYCYEYGRIIHGAIPTLQLGHNDTAVHGISQADVSYKKRKREPNNPKSSETNATSKCCYPECNEKSKGSNVYELPKLKMLREHWYESMGVSETATDESAPALCAVHFKLCYDNNINVIEALQTTANNNVVDGQELKECLNDLRDTYDIVADSSRIRSAGCAVPGCHASSRIMNIKLFQFPYNRELFEKWMHNTQVELDEGRRYMFKICSQHFESHCFNETSGRIRYWAVPTLRLPPSDNASHEIYPNPSPDQMERRSGSTQHSKCCIASCVNASLDIEVSSAQTTFYNFPKDGELFQKWIYNTQVSMLKALTSRICALHFEKACINKRLRFWAVPTLALGHTLTDIYTNPVDKLELVERIASKDLAEETLEEEVDDELNASMEAAVNSPVKAITFERDTARHCRISDCQSHISQAGVALFKFPADKQQCEKWQHNTNVEVDTSCPWRFRICHLHFAPECMSSKINHLRRNAIPTLNLGPDRPDVIYENQIDFNDKRYYPEKQDKPGQQTAILEVKDEEEQETAFPDVQVQCTTSIKEQETDTSKSKISASALRCAIPTCGRVSDQPRIRLHKLPQNSILQQKWLYNCRISEIKENSRTRICGIHFPDYCFHTAKRQLKFGSIPTLQLGHDDANIYQNAPSSCTDAHLDDTTYLSSTNDMTSEITADNDASEITNDVTSEYGVNCCIRGCPRHHGSTKKSARFFQFPSNKKMLSKWLLALKMEYDTARPWDYNICDLHFEAQSFDERNNLLASAVPSNIITTATPEEIQTSAPSAMPKISVVKPVIESVQTIGAETESRISPILPQDGIYNEIRSGHRKCSLIHCQKTMEKDNVKTYKFPSSREQQEKWAHNLRVKYDPNCHWKFMVCGTHFEAQCLNEKASRTLLHRWAVPTLCLGPNPPAILFTNENARAQYEAEFNASVVEEQSNSDVINVAAMEKDDEEKEEEEDYQFGEEPPCKRSRLTYNYDNSNTMEDDEVSSSIMQYDDNSLLDVIREEEERSSDAGTPVFGVTTGVLKKTKKERFCSVYHCQQKRSATVKLFRPPSEHAVMLKWAHNLRMEFPEHNRSMTFICSAHFEPHLIGTTRLVRGAIPTLNLGHSFANIYRNKPTVRQTESIKSRESHNTVQENSVAKASTLAKPPILVKSISTLQLPNVIPVAHSMRQTCSVPLCNNTEALPNIKLFSKFPEDFELFTKWCFNLKIDPRKYVDGAYNVCSAHFEPYCIGGHSLRVWAVPTLQLGHVRDHIHLVERPAEAELKCCLPHCGRKKSTDSVTFFNFPKGDLYKAWCQLLQIDEGLYRNTDKKICSAHFTPDSYSGGNLRPGMKPSLHLGPLAVAQPGHAQKPKSLPKQIPTRIITQFTSKCIVRTCAEMQHLHRFPENRNLCVKWCHNLKIDYDAKLPKNSNFKICQKHFESNCIHNSKLHGEAVPTLQLGHNDTNVFKNTAAFTTATRSTPSYDDNCSMRTSVSTINTIPIDGDTTADMDIEEDTYYADIDERNLLPQSNFVAAGDNEVIELDDDDDDDELIMTFN